MELQDILYYLVIIAIFVISAMGGKKKKQSKRSSMMTSDEITERNRIQNEEYDELLRKIEQERKEMFDSRDYIDYYDNVESDEYEGKHPVMVDDVKRMVKDAKKTSKTPEFHHIDFNLRKAIIYSEIINRKY